MKNKTKGIGLGIGLVCVVILLLLLLTRCGGEASAPQETTVPATAAAESVPETTAPVETTEATEEATEPAEETTEETEEATEPTQGNTSGNTNRPGTGGFVGGTVPLPDDDDDSGNGSTGVTEPVVADPGTAENAYTEVLSQLPDSVSTVKISSEETTFYNVYNAGGAVLTIPDGNAFVVYNGQTYKAQDGVVTVALAEVEAGLPVSLELGSTAAEAAVLTLNYALPTGTAENPEVLADVTEFTAALDGAADGRYYSFTTDQAGVLSLNVAAIEPADAVCDIILTKGETVTKLSESADGIVTMDMEAEETVTIQVVVTPEGTAAQVTINGIFAPLSGTAENPILLNVPEDTLNVPAGQTLYYTGRVDGMLVTLTGENVSVLHNDVLYTPESGVISLTAAGAGMWEPPVFAVTNLGQTDAAYPVTFAYPVGHVENPAELLIGENTAAIAAGGSEYYYTWTPLFDGVLTITMDSANTAGWSYCINNETAMVYGDWHFSDDDPLTASERIRVSADDKITVVVSTYDPQAFEKPQGQVLFQADFLVGSGTAEDPFQLTGGLEDALTVGPGETVYYQGRFTGMLMTLTGEDVTVSNNGNTATDENGKVELIVSGGNMYNPPIIAVTNNSTEAKTYPVVFTYPVGSSENPEELVIGTNTASIVAGDEDGYYYSWIATQDGILTISMADSNTTGWVYRVNNLTASQYGRINRIGDADSVSTEFYQVAAGDVIDINVSTFDVNTGNAVAGNVVFEASFVEGYGTEEVPHPWVGATSFTITVPGGETVYYQGRFGGMEMTLTGENVSVEHDYILHNDSDGVVTLLVTGGNNYNPPLFAITNHGAAAAEYTVTFNYPVGTDENPAKLVMGSNSITLAARDEDGYVFGWTAEADGVLTVTMSEQNTTGWYYFVNNITAYRYGVQHSSADAEQVPSESIPVSEGDLIKVSVNTCGADAWDSPAGTVLFTASFAPEAEAQTTDAAALAAEEEAEGTRENPDRIYDLLLNAPDAEELETIPVTVEEGSEGFFFKWRVKEDGVLTFAVQEHPELENVRTNITLYRSEDENGEKIESVEEFFSLWNEDTEADTVSMLVKAGEEIIVWVTVKAPESEVCTAAELTIFGIFEAGEALSQDAEAETVTEQAILNEEETLTEPQETEASEA